MMLKSFPPVINAHTRLLVIGSMPGEASLRAQQYYAYKYNQFWKMTFELFAGGREPKSYADKLQTLLTNRIGLWDTLAACERPGSLDSDIRLAKPNDFPALFKQYPAVKTLLFNGQTGYKYFLKFFGRPPGIACRQMPSTSPANAGTPYAKKLEIWRAALQEGLRP